jgi:hypothetical protein
VRSKILGPGQATCKRHSLQGRHFLPLQVGCGSGAREQARALYEGVATNIHFAGKEAPIHVMFARKVAADLKSQVVYQ